MIPISTLRNCRLSDGKFGEVFWAEDGDKFIIGRPGNGELVAVMVEGDFGKKRPFYFSPLESWTRHGVAIAKPSFFVEPTSLAKPDSVPPGSILLDKGIIHIAGFSGQTYQPVAISGDAGRLGDDAVAFTNWAVLVEEARGKATELFKFAAE